MSKVITSLFLVKRKKEAIDAYTWACPEKHLEGYIQKVAHSDYFWLMEFLNCFSYLFVVTRSMN